MGLFEPVKLGSVGDYNVSYGGILNPVSLTKNQKVKQSEPNPLVQSGLKKIQDFREQQSNQQLEPLKRATFEQPNGQQFQDRLEPINQPTLSEFIDEAKKLGSQQTQAQADILRQQIAEQGDAFARQLYSQNVGASSGVGQQIVQRELADFEKRLLPVVQQVGAQVGEKALAFAEQRRQEELDNIRQQELFAREDRNRLYDDILTGKVDKSQMSDEDWARLGITDPQSVKTLRDVDLETAMVADGYDPNNPNDIQTYRESLRNATANQQRQQIVSSYIAANDGQVPSPDEIEMMLLIFNGGTGVLTPEEEAAIIGQYNDEQWAKTMAKARAMNPPQKEGKVLCTELHRQGFLPDDVYASDFIVGKTMSYQDPCVVEGYHYWAKPLVYRMRQSRLLTAIVKPFVKAWAYEMHHQVTGKKCSSFIGKLLVFAGVPLCRLIGKQILKRRVLLCR